jgi:hypothetical protein
MPHRPAAAQLKPSPAIPPKVLLVGRDLHEGERVRRLLSYGRAAAQVAVCGSPCDARRAVAAHGAPDVLVLEDRAWPAVDAEALAELRQLCRKRSRGTGLILSRRWGELHQGERVPEGVPVVERPYRLDELVPALQLVLLRTRA